MSLFDAGRAALAFVRLRPRLVRYVAGYTGDPDAAEDIVQEVYVRLHDRPPNDPSRLKTWLFTVATNLARDGERTERRRARLLERQVEQVPGPRRVPDPAELAELREERARVQKALDLLSAKERTALMMRESGFRHREIAEAIGTTTKTVGTLMTRALEKVGRRLAGEDARR